MHVHPLALYSQELRTPLRPKARNLTGNAAWCGALLGIVLRCAGRGVWTSSVELTRRSERFCTYTPLPLGTLSSTTCSFACVGGVGLGVRGEGAGFSV